jgi:hypothetical protein
MVVSVMNHGTIVLLAVEILVMHQSGNLTIGQKRLPHPVSSTQSNKGLLFLGYKLANQTVFAQISSDLQNFFVAYQMDPQIWPVARFERAMDFGAWPYGAPKSSQVTKRAQSVALLGNHRRFRTRCCLCIFIS